MNIETKENLYQQASLWKDLRIPDETIENCRNNYPIIAVSLRGGLRVLRVENFGMGIPYLGEITRVLNENLPPAYPRFTIEQLTEEFHKLPDGRVVDFKETWNGNTFLIEEDGKLVGVAIGRREVVIDQRGSSVFTGRGYIPVVVASREIWGTPKIALLSLPIKSLTEAGVTEIRGSCASSNIFADKLFSRLAVERQQEDDWIRYKFNPEIGNQFFEFIVRKFCISEESARILITPTRGRT